MVAIDDNLGLEDRFQSAREDLENADIAAADRQAIAEFVAYRRETEELSLNTCINDCGNLKRAAERVDGRLLDLDADAVERFFQTLITPESRGGYGLDADGGGIYNYKRVCRVFFDWLDDNPDYGAYDFPETIELDTGTSDESVDRDAMLDQDEIQALKEAANHPRDRAIIEFLADTAARRTLALQLRVGDVDGLDGARPHYTPNPNGLGQKDAPNRRYPLLYSQAELRTYINRHHIDPRDHAPLFPVLERHYDRDAPEESALSGDRLATMLKECADRAGVDSPVNPHNFRHSAVTRMRAEGYNADEIIRFTGWADKRMLERYDHATALEKNDLVRERAGTIDEAGSDDGPTVRPCRVCGSRLDATTSFCPQCGSANTREAMERRDAVDDDVVASIPQADDDEIDALLALRERIREDPDLLDALAGHD
jgi:integrase/recombinase XerD